MKHIPSLSILKYPDARLLQRAEEVATEDFDEAVIHCRSMIDVMKGIGGWGLSAPQVAVPWRMFVVGGPGVYEPMICVNPRIVRVGEVKIFLPEGCLSFPGERNSIERPGIVQVEYTNSIGKLINATLSSWPARVFQHEIDHLDGKVFIDYWLPAARKKYLKRLGVTP